jgi:Spy/CpxP family protein refolding chaperone
MWGWRRQRMRNKFSKYILILSLLLNFSLLGAAGYTYYNQSPNRSPAPVNCVVRDNHLFRELSLKPDQIKLFQQKALTFHGLMGKKRLEVDQKREALLSLLRTDSPDDKALEEAIARINNNQHDMQKMVIAHILEYKSLLDKKQQKKFLDLIQGAMGKRKETLCP